MDFEELDYRQTSLGELVLRRRTDPALGIELHEVRLGDAWLMSSLFTEGEVALARLGLAGLEGPLDVVVGGLGLGYTAQAVLEHPAVRSLAVVEALPEVIDWHRRGLVPLGPALCADARCALLDGDFFELAAGPGFDPSAPGRRFDAILVDIDHSPSNHLHPLNAKLYRRDGLARLAAHLAPGSAFALWSDEPPEDRFLDELRAVFSAVDAHVVPFRHPVHGHASTNTVYVARSGRPGP